VWVISTSTLADFKEAPSLPKALPTCFSCQFGVPPLVTIAKKTFNCYNSPLPLCACTLQTKPFERREVAKVKMPIIIYPNLGAQPIGAIPARMAPPPPSALVRRGSGFSRTFKASLRSRSSSSLESTTCGHSSRDTLADTYHLTRGASPSIPRSSHPDLARPYTA
jgi:hypothetical protein